MPLPVSPRSERGKKRKLEEHEQTESVSKKQKLSAEPAENKEDESSASHSNNKKQSVKSTKSSKATKSTKTAKSTKSSKSTKSKSKSTKKSKAAGTLKGQDATLWIKDFMTDQNRPHSKSSLKHEIPVNTVKIGDAQINKSLEELVEDLVLVKREFGKKTKTKIYWVDQEGLDEDAEDEERAELRMKELQQTIKDRRSALNSLKKRVNETKQTPTDDQLTKQRAQQYVEWKELDVKLKELEGNGPGKRRVITKEDTNAVYAEFQRFAKAWKERKGTCMEMIDKAFGNSNKTTKKVLQDDLRGETDEENEQHWSQYKEMYTKSCTVVQQIKDNKRKHGKK